MAEHEHAATSKAASRFLRDHRELVKAAASAMDASALEAAYQRNIEGVSGDFVLLSPIGDVNVDELEFHWEEVPGATCYEVCLLDEDENVIWRRNTEEQTLDYPGDEDLPEIGRVYRWRVDATTSEGALVARAALHPYQPTAQELSASPSRGATVHRLPFWRRKSFQAAMAAAAVIVVVGVATYDDSGFQPSPQRGQITTPTVRPQLQLNQPVTDTRPTFTFDRFPSGVKARLSLLDEEFNGVFTQVIDGPEVPFPDNAESLKPGVTYHWRLSWRQSGDSVQVQGNFQVAPAAD